MFNSQVWVDRLVKMRQLPFIQILQRTMVTLFPLAIIGSGAWIISQVFFSPTGFLGEITYLRHWLPYYRFWGDLFHDIYTVSIGWLAPYAAVVSAQLTIRQHNRELPIIGLSAMASYVLIFLHSLGAGRMGIDMRYYNANWFIVGVLVGYSVGLIFVKFGRQSNNFQFKSNDIISSSFDNLKPLLIVLSLVFVLHFAYAVIREMGADAQVTQAVDSMLTHHSSYGLTLVLSLVATVLSWLGFAESVDISNHLFTNELYVNLNYALTHKNVWHVPYPFTPQALYNGYGQFGGIGISLALLIAILWVSHHRNQRGIAKVSAVPVFFNVNLPLTFGIVLILNPIFLLPFVLLPLFNMVCASGLIFLHVIPPLVYPIPNGTPGILVPFMGSGGDWVTLLVSLLLLVIDVWAYIPFVKLAEKVEDRLQEMRKEAANHANE